MENTTDKYIGKILDDRYEIIELIGSGGMANVYKALCHRLNRYDAVKIMRDETASTPSCAAASVPSRRLSPCFLTPISSRCTM